VLLLGAGIIGLTVLTQIGGVVLLFAWVAGRLLVRHGRVLATTALFLAAYAVLTIAVVPPVAALGGRVPLPCGSEAGQRLRVPLLLCALNRHYVDARLAGFADALATDVDRQFPGTTTVALDGNFPFFDGFPLLPHLSHDDGQKLDIAFYYAGPDGYAGGALRSPIGYWAFETPPAGDECPDVWLTLRWDMAALQPLFPSLTLEPQRTRAALEWLFEQGPAFGLERVFLEPYLAERLGVASPLLGFQGCRAARHDDHIHLQMRAPG
jgi:hypothetical protein